MSYPCVLIVDDEALNRLILQELLGEMRLVIEEAKNGQEAVEMARIKAYDLILMDIQMPILDGLESTRRIRRIPGYACVPIIAVSANDMSESEQRCLKAGMNGYFSKPLDPERFSLSILEWLGTSGQARLPMQ